MENYPEIPANSGIYDYGYNFSYKNRQQQEAHNA